MAGVTVALVGFFAFVILRMTQPAMSVLYTDLSQADAAAIIRDFEARGIRYEQRADGTTILAPKDEVTRLRMDFAAKGVPSGGSVGYEIFDKGDAFSATSFVQGVNHIRALEGELSRTIRSISRVQAARVHLVIPERRLFERDREGPRASIALRLSGELDAGQVRAIRHLVATAIDGLKPTRVSIVDERGRLLADGAQDQANPQAAADEKQTAFERRMKAQVEDIVAGVVGNGRARVQIAAEMDVNRIESRSETFDPESRVVRSTQTRTEAQATSNPEGGVSVGNELPGANGAQGPAPRDQSNKNEEIVNYEISRTTRTEVMEGGRVKRLSVAVLVDGIYTRSAAGEMTYQPRPQEELDRIAALVRSAIGFDRNRGDQIEVVNLRLADGATAEIPAETTSLITSLFSFTKDDIVRLAEILVLALLTLIVLLMVVRPMLRKALSPDAPAKGGPGGGGAGGAGSQGGMIAVSGDGPVTVQIDNPTSRMLELAKVNGQVQSQSIDRIGEIVKGNPQESVAIIRQWIREP
jgi:flagellar M-ring protein FliF